MLRCGSCLPMSPRAAAGLQGLENCTNSGMIGRATTPKPGGAQDRILVGIIELNLRSAALALAAWGAGSGRRQSWQHPLMASWRGLLFVIPRLFLLAMHFSRLPTAML